MGDIKLVFDQTSSSVLIWPELLLYKNDLCARKKENNFREENTDQSKLKKKKRRKTATILTTR